MQWNSALYDQKHDFVAKYGEGLLAFLPENPAQAILDLGCGTGTLTARLEALPEQTGQALLARAEELARPKLWDGGHWTADYRRLRAVARKPVK